MLQGDRYCSTGYFADTGRYPDCVPPYSIPLDPIDADTADACAYHAGELIFRQISQESWLDQRVVEAVVNAFARYLEIAADRHLTDAVLIR